ncbi:MAG: hypothetical protein JNK50_15665 [Bacteroidia bacterium]|nr:hypothetical protein [Bacteroidia bacterium]
MTVSYILFALFVLFVFFRVFIQWNNVEKKPEDIVEEIQNSFNARLTETTLKQFDHFKTLNSPEILKSLELYKDGLTVNVVFVRYKYVVPNKIRWSPPDDISIYAFFIISADSFNVGDYPIIDTTEVKNNSVLIRFDRVPISLKKTTSEIKQVLSTVKSFA